MLARWAWSAAFLAALLLVVSPSSSGAGKVFLNGVSIDGVRNQEFVGVEKVEIDKAGNVRIEAPGYAVEGKSASVRTPTVKPRPALPAAPRAPAEPRQAASPPVPEPSLLANRYFVVAESESAGGSSDFDVDVFVNEKWLRRIRCDEQQVVQELTRSLRPGANKISLVAVKRKQRTSESPEDRLSLVVGLGTIAGDEVHIDEPLGDLRLDASQVDGVQRDLDVEAE
ncbi:MAG: hypothetical protein HY901_13695 [Deltaproteobacteria bacterium]|nr:hypothetical protein [Deltaproteobacteria bacterium]